MCLCVFVILSVTLARGIYPAFTAGPLATARAAKQIKSTMKISLSLFENGRKMVDHLWLSLRTVFVICNVRIVGKIDSN